MIKNCLNVIFENGERSVNLVRGMRFSMFERFYVWIMFVFCELVIRIYRVV